MTEPSRASDGAVPPLLLVVLLALPLELVELPVDPELLPVFPPELDPLELALLAELPPEPEPELLPDVVLVELDPFPLLDAQAAPRPTATTTAATR